MSQVLAVQVPYGAQEGMKLKATTEDGRQFYVKVPVGARPGMTLMVNVPPPPSAAERAVGVPSAPQEAPEPQIVQQGATSVEAADTKDLIPCMGCCCVIASLYCKFPECFGAHAKGVVTCLEVEMSVCMTGRTERSLCLCCKNEVEIIKPTVCAKMNQRCFCLDYRCAFPFDDEVPCICAVAGMTLAKDYKCVCECLGKLDNEEEGGAPQADEMER